MTNPRVVVVVPTYNERDSIAPTLDRCQKSLSSDYHILVVDDTSPDGTGDVVRAYIESLPEGTISVSLFTRSEKGGLGKAYAAGMTEALTFNPEYVVQMDADGSHPVEELPTMVAIADATQGDLVVGSRYVQGGSLAANWGLHRRALSKFANVYVKSILGMRIGDITAGYNLWRAAFVPRLQLSSIDSQGYSFQVETKYRAVKLGGRVYEHPIRFSDREEGVSKMSFQTQWESMVMPWRLRRK